jgi:hypothetical protein
VPARDNIEAALPAITHRVDGSALYVYAGENAWADFFVRKDRLVPLSVFVDKHLRRRRLATAMYDYARKLTGKPVAVSDAVPNSINGGGRFAGSRTPDGRAFRAAYDQFSHA